jgi:hypothetical protein
MHPVFALAAIVPDTRVLLWKLKPFQLGHAYLLDALESPYMVGGDVEKPDLALAAWICSQDSTQAMAGIRAGRPHAIVMQTVARATRRANWIKADRVFTQYIERGMRHPRRWGSSFSAGPRAAWQWIAAVRLTGGDPCKLSKVWDMPMLDVTCYLTSKDASEGDDSIVSEYEEQAAEQLKAAQ